MYQERTNIYTREHAYNAHVGGADDVGVWQFGTAQC